MMITVKEAERKISQYIFQFSKEKVSLVNSLGKILRENIFAKRNQPPFHRVAMDGIGISFNSWNEGRREFVVEDIQRAGMESKVLKNKENCLEVMTGSILPINVSCVIPYEKINIEDGKANLKKDLLLNYMDNVHREGSDYKKDDILLSQGTMICSSHIGILASEGHEHVEVSKTPSIAVISTGDELVNISETPLPHQIRMSNTYSLIAELNAHGFNNVSRFHLPDNERVIESHLEDIIKKFEVIIISGGVSAGKYDFIPTILTKLGVTKIFHKVRQRPGKPMIFCKGRDNQVVFGLPGNPVSSLVSLRRYIIPFLMKSLGREKQEVFVALGDDIKFEKKLTYFPAVKINVCDLGNTKASVVKSQGSGDYFSLALSDGFLELPEEQNNFNKGEAYLFYRWGTGFSDER